MECSENCMEPDNSARIDRVPHIEGTLLDQALTNLSLWVQTFMHKWAI